LLGAAGGLHLGPNPVPDPAPSRLAAVWFADIVGYSRVASLDETSALRLVELLRSLVEETLAEHGGRLVKGTGDGALAEFASADAAVRSALALERRFAERADPIVPGARLRIGVHVGEVVPGGDGDLFGDGVNTAARLQQSAEPGEVVVSEDVWRPLRQRSQHRFTPLGERRLKGLAAPIRVFRVVAAESATGGAGARTHPTTPRRPSPRREVLFVVGAGLLAVLLVVLLARERSADSGRELPRPPGSAAAPDPAVAIASLAVLPFDDLGTNPESEYFADGLTDELIASLGRLEELRVAGRSSSFAFKGRDVDVREVGRELGVGAVLEGGVRNTGERVRVTVQLIDARTGFQLWSETYDRESKDIFAVQEEIARDVGEALDLRLPRAMGSFRIRARAPDREAYDLYLRGRHAWRSRTRDGLELALEDFQAAIARDPEFAEAHAGMADAYLALVAYGYRSRDTLSRAREAADRALALQPDLVEALASRGYLRSHNHEFAASLADFRRAIELNPSYPLAHHWYSLALSSLGRFEEAIPEHRRALELDPLSPTPHSAYALTLLNANRLEEAEEMAARANELAPDLYFPLSVLGRIHEAQGRRAEALEAAERAAALAPEIAGARAQLARMHARVGDRQKALDILAELEADPDPCAACIAEVHVALGQYEEAFPWLDVRIWFDDSHGGGFAPKVDPLYDPIREDPRFRRFLEDAGLV
jgi:TolB-like protein/class 3 adenylate cyclase/Tfp pilus assembly protein PilF